MSVLAAVKGSKIQYKRLRVCIMLMTVNQQIGALS